MNYNDIYNSQSGSNAARLSHQMNTNGLKETKKNRPLHSPKARLFQTQETWILQLALPNIELENVNIEERGQDLYIYAENNQERFERSFKLPPHERFTEIQAELSKGLLSIEIKAAIPNTRKIKVHSA